MVLDWNPRRGLAVCLRASWLCPAYPTIGLPPSFHVIQKNIISPLGSIEYSRLNLRGRGETASIATFLSRLDQRASFTYLHPQFRGLNWNALWSFSVERTTQNPLFTARLGQGSFQIERILDAAKTDAAAISLHLSAYCTHSPAYSELRPARGRIGEIFHAVRFLRARHAR